MAGRLFATVLGLLLSSNICFATLTMSYVTTVSNVIDGNTIEISKKLFQGETTLLPSGPVILDGVDAPELDQPMGTEARQFLLELIKDKKIRVLEDTDMGRSRGAWVHLGDKCVNLELVRNGFAWLTHPMVHESGITPNQMMQALEEAKNNKVGIWKEPNPIPPSEWRNRQSGKSSTTNPPQVSLSASTLLNVKLTVGMKRAEAERLIAEATGTPSKYDLNAMDISPEVRYQDKASVLVVRYKPGMPAPQIQTPDRHIQGFSPVDGEVLSWEFKTPTDAQPKITTATVMSDIEKTVKKAVQLAVSGRREDNIMASLQRMYLKHYEIDVKSTNLHVKVNSGDAIYQISALISGEGRITNFVVNTTPICITLPP